MSVVTIAYHVSAATEADRLRSHLRTRGYRTDSMVCDASETPLAERLLGAEGPLLLLVNDEFLHSVHCQLGLLEAYPTLQERAHFHPVLASSQRRGPGDVSARVMTSLARVSDVIRYMNFWQHAYLTRRRELGSAAGSTGAEELRVIRRISQEIGDVLRLIRSGKPTDVRALSEASADTLVELLGAPTEEGDATVEVAVPAEGEFEQAPSDVPPQAAPPERSDGHQFDEEPVLSNDSELPDEVSDDAAVSEVLAGGTQVAPTPQNLDEDSAPEQPAPAPAADDSEGAVADPTDETSPESELDIAAAAAVGASGMTVAAAATNALQPEALPDVEHKGDVDTETFTQREQPGAASGKTTDHVDATDQGDVAASGTQQADATPNEVRPADAPMDGAATKALPAPEPNATDEQEVLDQAALRKLRRKARRLTRARNLQTFLATRDELGGNAAGEFAAEALREDPGDHRLRYAYAITLLERAEEDGGLDGSASAAITPLFDSPLAAHAHIALGQLGLRRRDFGSASAHFRKAFKIDRDADRELSYWLGTLLQDEFDDERARAARYLKHAAKRSKRNRADANYRLGLIEWSAGRRRRAIRRLKMAQRLEPDHPFAAYDLAALYLERNRPLRAQAAFAEAARANPELDTPANRQAFTPVDADGEPTRLPETRADKFLGFVRERGGVHEAAVESDTSSDVGTASAPASEEAYTDGLAENSEAKTEPSPAPAPQSNAPAATVPPVVNLTELARGNGPDRRAAMTVFVTGASSGIGAAAARRFAQAGHRLILTGRRVEALLALSAELKAAHATPVRLLSFDVADYPAAEKMVGSLEGAWAEVDVLVNNAGKARGLKPVHEMTAAEIDDMVDTNVKGLLYVTRLVAAGMVRRGRGHVINVCSTAGHEVYAGGTVYCATKHAVDAITRGARLDLYKHGIRVSQVSPAAVEETEFSKVRFDGDEGRAASVYEGWQPLRASDVADELLRIAEAPPHVNVQDVVLLGTQQANSTNVDRSGRERYAPTRG